MVDMEKIKKFYAEDLKNITEEYAVWTDEMQTMWRNSYNKIEFILQNYFSTLARMWKDLGYSQDQIMEAFDLRPSEFKAIMDGFKEPWEL